MSETFFGKSKNSRWKLVENLNIEVVLDNPENQYYCFPIDDAEASAQIKTFVFKVARFDRPVSDNLSIENLILWTKTLPMLNTLAFHFSNFNVHLVEKLIHQLFSNISIFGLPEAVRHFHVSSATYLGSFSCLESLTHFVL